MKEIIFPNIIKGKISLQNYKFTNKNNLLPKSGEGFKIKKSRPIVTIIFRPKVVILEYRFYFDQVKTMV